MGSRSFYTSSNQIDTEIRMGESVYEVTSCQAWDVLSMEEQAILVDVRTTVEWMHVGIPDLSSLHKKPLFVSWRNYPDMELNGQFASEIEANAPDKNTTLLFLCKAGGRSADAAEEMAKRGYVNCCNIIDGFEGNLNNQQSRGVSAAGWKAENLPWEQK